MKRTIKKSLIWGIVFTVLSAASLCLALLVPARTDAQRFKDAIAAVALLAIALPGYARAFPRKQVPAPDPAAERARRRQRPLDEKTLAYGKGISFVLATVCLFAQSRTNNVIWGILFIIAAVVFVCLVICGFALKRRKGHRR